MLGSGCETYQGICLQGTFSNLQDQNLCHLNPFSPEQNTFTVSVVKNGLKLPKKMITCAVYALKYIPDCTMPREIMETIQQCRA